MHDRAAQRLVIAGRLLQAKGNSFHRQVAKRVGETYPQAVLRVLQEDLADAERQEVKTLVDWIENYERHDQEDPKRKERNDVG